MDSKKSDLAKIHIAKKQLVMDDDSYRDMLHDIAGVRSAAQLNQKQRWSVIRELKKRGATFTKSNKHGKPKNFDKLPDYVTKVEALLADMKLPWSYADSIAKNITGGNGNNGQDPGIAKLQWVKKPEHWRAIITALTKEQIKRKRLERVQQLQAQKNISDDQIAAMLHKHNFSSGDWQRHPLKLLYLIDELTLASKVV